MAHLLRNLSATSGVFLNKLGYTERVCSCGHTSEMDIATTQQNPEPMPNDPVGARLEETAADQPRFDFRSIYQSPAFIPGLLVALGLALVFLPLWPRLIDLWNGEDGYYSHGFIVPLMSVYIVYRSWPRIREIPVKPGYVAVPLLFLTIYAMYPATYSKIEGLMSVGLLATLMFSAWIVAGFRWMLALTPAILYLGFALPLWHAIINNTTNPLQIISTKVAYYLLKTMGFYVYQSDPTVVYMNSFQLNVDVPCSGLKLLLALSAFTVFFVLIARLKWAANLFMLAMIPFLAILINGLRIALIGVVGETQGREAGIAFHDYSGYVTLIICFVVLFKIARILGWKD